MKDILMSGNTYRNMEEEGRYAALLLQSAIDDLIPDQGVKVSIDRICVEGVEFRIEFRFNMKCIIHDTMPREATAYAVKDYAQVFRLKLIDALKRINPTIGELGIYGSSLWRNLIENRRYIPADGSDNLSHATQITNKEWQR